MNHRLICALAAGAALSFGFAASANAAGHDFCSDYARAAINQVRGAMNNPRCLGRMQGPRWSSDWHTHYDWCRGVSRDQAWSERDARRATIESCRSY
jgi:hypothetical protein